MVNLAILLTATIKVQVKGGHFTTNQRVNMYQSTLRYYSQTIGKKLPIIFLENSDYDLSVLKNEFSDLLDIEFIQFRPDSGLPFDNSKGKGFNEYLMIGCGVEKSKKIKSCTHFLKITGRYPMLNIVAICEEIERYCDDIAFMCDIKETNIFRLLGYNNDGHWGDSRFWTANIDYYKEKLIDCYKWMDDSVGRYAEEYIYKLSVANRNDPTFIFRFKHQVRFDGFSGAVTDAKLAKGNYSYNSPLARIKYYIRSILRRIFPNLWI